MSNPGNDENAPRSFIAARQTAKLDRLLARPPGLPVCCCARGRSAAGQGAAERGGALMIKRRDMLKQTTALFGSALPWTIGVGVPFIGQNARGEQGLSRIPAGVAAKDDLALVNGKFVDGRGTMTTALADQERPHHGRGPGEGNRTPTWRVVDLRGRYGHPGTVRFTCPLREGGRQPRLRGARVSNAPSRSRSSRRPSRAGRRPFPPGAFITCIGGWNHLQFAEARAADEGRPGCRCPGPCGLSFRAPARTPAPSRTRRGQTILASRGSEGRRRDRACRTRRTKRLTALRGVQTADDRRRASAAAQCPRKRPGTDSGEELGQPRRSGADAGTVAARNPERPHASDLSGRFAGGSRGPHRQQLQPGRPRGWRRHVPGGRLRRASGRHEHHL